MKMLKITIKYGDLMIPKSGVPFVDSSGNQQIVTMTGDMDKMDGDILGQQIFDAIGEIASGEN
jgi:anti-anti-sigma regulatory factor